MLKRGQGLPLNVIIIAIIVLVVLVVLITIFTTRTGKFGQALEECRNQGGMCTADCKGAVIGGVDCGQAGVIIEQSTISQLQGYRHVFVSTSKPVCCIQLGK